MFTRKHESFNFFVTQKEEHFYLYIIRGKIQIYIEIDKKEALNEVLLNKFVDRFIEDLDFRKELTVAANPLNTNGFIDIDTGKEFISHFDVSQGIHQLIFKEIDGIATRKDYLNLRIKRDKFSSMTLSELAMRIPKNIVNRVLRELPYKRLQLRALRWIARGLPVGTTMRKMNIDRIYKNY